MRVSVYTGEVEKMFMEFNTVGSDRSNWYRLERVLNSSYTDMDRSLQTYFILGG
jgi:hypothetical protein